MSKSESADDRWWRMVKLELAAYFKRREQENRARREVKRGAGKQDKSLEKQREQKA